MEVAYHMSTVEAKKLGYRYLRLSQATEANQTTIPDQRIRCERIEEAEGITIIGEYIDYGHSAFDRDDPTDRPAYGELLGALANNPDAVAVVASANDRLWRDDLEKALYTHTVGKSAPWVFVPGNALNLSNPHDDFILTIITAVAKLESAIKRQRIRDNKAKQRRLGISTQPVVSLGFEGTRHGREKNDGLKLHEPEAVYVREAARMVLEGVSLTDVAQWFQANNVPKVRDANKGKPNGSRWLAQEVRSLLCSPRIAGLQAHEGKVIGAPEAWPKIIDQATWERLQAHFAQGRYGPRATRAGYYTGWVLCARPTPTGGLCGATMRRGSVGRKKTAVHRCHTCGNSVPESYVQEASHSWLLASVDSPDFAAMVAGTEAPDDSALMAELAQARAKIELYGNMLDDDEIGRTEYKRLKAKAQARIDKATRAIRKAGAHSALTEYIGDGSALGKLLCDPELSATAHRALFAATGHHLWVSPAERKGRGFDVKRLSILPDVATEEAA